MKYKAEILLALEKLIKSATDNDHSRDIIKEIVNDCKETAKDENYAPKAYEDDVFASVGEQLGFDSYENDTYELVQLLARETLERMGIEL